MKKKIKRRRRLRKRNSCFVRWSHTYVVLQGVKLSVTESDSRVRIPLMNNKPSLIDILRKKLFLLHAVIFLKKHTAHKSPNLAAAVDGVALLLFSIARRRRRASSHHERVKFMARSRTRAGKERHIQILPLRSEI